MAMIVLVEPEIPQNTGSIARTCAAMKVPLHLVGKLGFEISEKRVRRAGLDYWPYVDLQHHRDWAAFQVAVAPHRLWYFSTKGTRLHWDVQFAADDGLVFGSETKGLGSAFLSNVPSEQIIRIPIIEEQVRSLNLSNAVSIALYELLRQQRGSSC